MFSYGSIDTRYLSGLFEVPMDSAISGNHSGLHNGAVLRFYCLRKPKYFEYSSRR